MIRMESSTSQIRTPREDLENKEKEAMPLRPPGSSLEAEPPLVSIHRLLFGVKPTLGKTGRSE